jgi:hypothetical protein
MFAIPVKTYLGKDYTDKRVIMERFKRRDKTLHLTNSTERQENLLACSI